MNPEWSRFIFDWLPQSDFTFPRNTTGYHKYESAPSPGDLFDAGFAKGREVIVVTEQELLDLPADEWALLQRFISEPAKFINTQIHVEKLGGIRRSSAIAVVVEHEVPCVTVLM